MTETKTIDYITDNVVDETNKQFPGDENASIRLRIYDEIAEKLSGMARILRSTGAKKEETLFQ